MGFDIWTMNVPVMQPTVLQNERFLVNTWAYKNNLPQRGDIVAKVWRNVGYISSISLSATIHLEVINRASIFYFHL